MTTTKRSGVTERSFRDQPLTVAYIRDSVRKKSYVGDLFEALTFMLEQYDIVNNKRSRNMQFIGDVA